MLQIIAELFSARTLRRDDDDDDEKFADVWFVNKERIKTVSGDYKRKIDKVL